MFQPNLSNVSYQKVLLFSLKGFPHECIITLQSSKSWKAVVCYIGRNVKSYYLALIVRSFYYRKPMKIFSRTLLFLLVSFRNSQFSDEMCIVYGFLFPSAIYRDIICILL